MGVPLSLRRVIAASAVLVVAAGLLVEQSATAGPGHTEIVASVPGSKTPDIEDGSVSAIFDAGEKVIAVGNFTTAQNRNTDIDIPRSSILAFAKDTGLVDDAFVPAVDGIVNAVIAGPTAGTVFIGGEFNTVNGVTRRKVALLNVSDGSVVTSFAGPAFNGAVNDIALVDGRLLVGGSFTKAGQNRGGLASLNATTGALDNYLTTTLTEHHNWNGSGAKGPVGVKTLAASPTGTQLVVIGNFKFADGVLHDQVVKLDLGPTAATIATWNTDRYQPRCAANAFDSWIRDAAYSTDGSFFVIVTTGAPFSGTLCDTAARWEAGATGTGQQPTWVNYTGGDTFLSVTITEEAVYAGGHMRWVNNSLGGDSAGAGAVPRPSLVAMDPESGMPLAWNPGRNPRGYGVSELYATPDGLWIGHDTDWMGNRKWRRERIAFLSTRAGYTQHAKTVAALPGNVYQAGNVTGHASNDITRRAYDGTTAGALAGVGNPDGTQWSTVRGAFWVGGTLFYGSGNSLYRREFDGTTFGAPTVVDPYHDPLWDTVTTGSGPNGQTYRGVFPNFYNEVPNVTGMFYAQGRLYYTLSGQNSLFWRWFSPDSGAVGADRFTATGSTGFSNSGGVFVSGGSLYLVHRTAGTLSRMDFVNGAPNGSSTVVSGPAVDGQDWRGRAVFVAP